MIRGPCTAFKYETVLKGEVDEDKLKAEIDKHIQKKYGSQLICSWSDINERILIGDSEFSTDGRDVYYRTIAIKLTQSEYDFIEPLIKHLGQPLSMEEIIDSGNFVSAGDYHTDEQALYRIRKKFGSATGKKGTTILSRSKGKFRLNLNV